MTFKDHPTDFMDNPDGRDYHYRFHANDEEAWKYLKFARWKGRMIEMYPKDMKHLRVKIGHVTFKTYDKMGYIKNMKEYACSNSWERVPYSRGKKEMKHANGGGSKIRAEVLHGTEWGRQRVEYHVDATPGEIKDAFENGKNEDAISDMMKEAEHWAVEERVDALRQEEAELREFLLEDCDHPEEYTKPSRANPGFVYCEKCCMDFDQHELEAARGATAQ